MNVLFSTSAYRNFQYGGAEVSQILKRYFLLFDQVYFDIFGLGDVEEEWLRWFMWASKPKGVSEEDHNKLREKFRKSLVTLWDAVEDAEKFEKDRQTYIVDRHDVFQNLYDYAPREIKKKYGADVNPWKHEDDLKGMIGDVWSDVAGNEIASQLNLGISPSYSPLIGDALRGTIRHSLTDLSTVFSKDLIIPSFDSLSWDQIFELRDDKYVKLFRSSFMNYLGPDTLTEEAFEIKILRDLWGLVRDINPSVLGSSISGVLSNVPGLPINPFGIGVALKDVQKQKDLTRRYGHLFFVHRINEKITINEGFLKF